MLSSVPKKHRYLSSSMAAMDSHGQFSLVRALFANRTQTTSPLQMCHPGQRLYLSDEYLHVYPHRDGKPVEQSTHQMICPSQLSYSITQFSKWH